MFYFYLCVQLTRPLLYGNSGLEDSTAPHILAAIQRTIIRNTASLQSVYQRYAALTQPSNENVNVMRRLQVFLPTKKKYPRPRCPPLYLYPSFPLLSFFIYFPRKPTCWWVFFFFSCAILPFKRSNQYTFDSLFSFFFFCFLVASPAEGCRCVLFRAFFIDRRHPYWWRRLLRPVPDAWLY